MKVSIIIPIWNGRKLIEKNLPKIIDAANSPSNNIEEIIIVDDASPDDSVEYINKNFKDKVRIVRLKNNRGFAGAVNMGVYASKNPLICLLNIDVIPSKDFLKSTVQLFQDSKVFAVTLHEKGYGPAIGRFDKGFIVHRPGKEINKVQKSFWASGGSAVFSRKLWIKLKGLDEDLFTPFYWEDVDIGYRAWKRGYNILWDPNALVNHEHETVISKDNFSAKYLQNIKERNYLLFNWKNITSNALWNKHKKALYRYTLRHPGYAKIIWLAWKKKDLVIKKREKEKKQTLVSDEAVFSKFQK